MEVTHDILDIEYYEKHKIKPSTLIDRKPAEMWIVRDLPVGANTTVATKAWGLAKQGDKIALPLFPYIANGNNPAVAMAFAFELGAKAAHEISKAYDVLRLHITIGDPVQEVNNMPGVEGAILRFWLGFAFQIKEQE